MFWMNGLPWFSQLATVGGVMLLACISPGPDLLAVTSHALSGRRNGLLAALGISTSHALWAALAIFGLGLILAQLAWLYEAVRIMGAAYLMYLGAKTLYALRKSAGQPAMRPAELTEPEPTEPAGAAGSAGRPMQTGIKTATQTGETGALTPPRGARAYRRGLLVGLTNPKAMAFFGSLFVTILPLHAPPWVQGATLGVTVAASLGWFASVTIFFSIPRIKTGYMRLRRPVDALMGVALLGLGAKLALERH